MQDEVNRLLAWAGERYGAEFLDGAYRELGWRPVKTVFISPSVDLGRVANATFASAPPVVSAQIRWLLSLVADKANAEEGESDFLSYLYFDRGYTGQLEALGFEDAKAREEELAAFLLDSIGES